MSAVKQTARTIVDSELDGEFLHLAHVVAMVSSFLVANVSRIDLPGGGSGWVLGHAEGNQALSMLRMADEFGERVSARLTGDAA